MECKWYGCQLVAEANGYCFKHKIYSGVKVEIPKPAPIKKVSKKQSVINRELGKQLKEWISENKKCEVRSPVCNGKVESTHHLQKRSPKNVLDKKKYNPLLHSL